MLGVIPKLAVPLILATLAVPSHLQDKRWHNQQHRCVSLQSVQQVVAKRIYSQPVITKHNRRVLRRMRACAWSAKAASNMRHTQLAYQRLRRERRVTHSLSPTAHVATPAQCESVSCLQQAAYSMAMVQYGSSVQANCVIDIISNHEDGSWEVDVPGQTGYGPYGLPQADPGNKMAAAGPDWATNGITQLRWMITIYIPQAWTTPCAADYNERIASYY